LFEKILVVNKKIMYFGIDKMTTALTVPLYKSGTV